MTWSTHCCMEAWGLANIHDSHTERTRWWSSACSSPGARLVAIAYARH
jgi:hypothetical protein